MSSRHFKPEIRVTSLRFSPTGEPRTKGCWPSRGGGHSVHGGPVTSAPGDVVGLGASGGLWPALSPVGEMWSSSSTTEDGFESCNLSQAGLANRKAGGDLPWGLQHVPAATGLGATSWSCSLPPPSGVQQIGPEGRRGRRCPQSWGHWGGYALSAARWVCPCSMAGAMQ